MTDGERTLTALAHQQCGVFTRAQAARAGMPRRTVQRRIQAGVWEPCTGPVLRLAGSVESWRQRTWIAVLAGGSGAAASRYTALTLHGLRCFPDADIDVVVPHPRNVRAPGVAFHEVTDLRPVEVVRRRGIATTTPARALVDCSGVMSVARLSRAFDDAVTTGITTADAVGDQLLALMRPGKRGLAGVATVLDRYSGAASVADSVAEAEFLRLVAGAGLPHPATQLPHPSPQRPGNLVDFAWEAVRLIVEIDGRTWHSRMADRLRDIERDRTAVAAGWQVMRIPVEHLRSDRAGVIADLASALAARS